jgi:hypothetical protein
MSGGSLHRRLQNNSEKFSRNLKTFIMGRTKVDHARVGSSLPRGQNKVTHMKGQENEKESYESQSY